MSFTQLFCKVESFCKKQQNFKSKSVIHSIFPICSVLCSPPSLMESPLLTHPFGTAFLSFSSFLVALNQFTSCDLTETLLSTHPFSSPSLWYNITYLHMHCFQIPASFYVYSFFIYYLYLSKCIHVYISFFLLSLNCFRILFLHCIIQQYLVCHGTLSLVFRLPHNCLIQL